MPNLRYIETGHGKDSLTAHEIGELDRDFDIKVEGFYILAPLTKTEWELILKKKMSKAYSFHHDQAVSSKGRK